MLKELFKEEKVESSDDGEIIPSNQQIRKTIAHFTTGFFEKLELQGKSKIEKKIKIQHIQDQHIAAKEKRVLFKKLKHYHQSNMEHQILVFENQFQIIKNMTNAPIERFKNLVKKYYKLMSLNIIDRFVLHREQERKNEKVLQTSNHYLKNSLEIS